jgi:hypothetical protein
MSDARDGSEERDGAGGERGFSIARSQALVPMLVLFGATVLAIILAIVRTQPFVGHEGVAATRAHGPVEFRELLRPPEPPEHTPAAAAAVLFPVPAPPFSDGIYPCSACHADQPPNPERRALVMHDEIVLRHDEEHRWCLDCHDAQDRDQLRLASGALVPFTESYRLCGQCHGTQYRDWREGIHGKRTGWWDGPKRYLLCVHCHNPHQPRFAAIKPLPPPVRPHFLRAGGGEDGHGG